MKRAIAIVVGTIAVIAPSVAAAQDPNEGTPSPPASRPPIAFHVGARVGVGAPVGSATENSGALARSIGIDVPMGLEAGVRLFDEHVRVAGLATLAPLVVKDCVGEEARCRGHQLELGGIVAYHFTPLAPTSSWVGIGAGWERLDLLFAEGGSTVQLVASGAMATAQVGFDIEMAPGLRVGPMLSASVGRYATIALDGVTTRDYDAAFHGWWVFAMRATFDP